MLLAIVQRETGLPVNKDVLSNGLLFKSYETGELWLREKQHDFECLIMCFYLLLSSLSPTLGLLQAVCPVTTRNEADVV